MKLLSEAQEEPAERNKMHVISLEIDKTTYCMLYTV